MIGPINYDPALKVVISVDHFPGPPKDLGFIDSQGYAPFLNNLVRIRSTQDEQNIKSFLKVCLALPIEISEDYEEGDFLDA